jgi:DnaJ-domain-containing protein 1
MPAQIVELDQTTFRSYIDAVGDAIVRVTEGSDTGIPAALIQYFNGEYPGAFQYCTIRRDAVAVEEWWKKNFKKGFLTMPMGRPAGSPGFYLFVRGAPVAWSPGKSGDARANGFADVDEAVAFRNNPRALANFRALREAGTTKLVAEAFERHLLFDPKARRHIDAKVAQAKADRQAQADEAARRARASVNNGQRRADPAAASTPTQTDDCTLLGVTSNATNDELKAAFSEKRKQNAPDKLAHMDPELQAFATERMKSINSAIDRIKAARGM